MTTMGIEIGSGALAAAAGMSLAASGCLLLWWSGRNRSSSQARRFRGLMRLLESWFNRRWQTAIPVTFSLATALMGVVLGSAVDRFAPQAPPAGRYEELILVVGGLTVLLLGTGAAMWRGRTNQSEMFGTALVIDERQVAHDPNVHDDFISLVRERYEHYALVPGPQPDQPIWALTGQDWGDRVRRLHSNLEVVRKLDRPDTPTSLFVKAPWPVAMQLGWLANNEGNWGDGLQLRVFPPDRLASARNPADSVRPENFVVPATKMAGAGPVDAPELRCAWIGEDEHTAHHRPDSREPIVIAIRLPANVCGPLKGRKTTDPTESMSATGFQIADGSTSADQALLVHRCLIVESAQLVDHTAIPLGQELALAAELAARLGAELAELDRASLQSASSEGRLFLACTIPGELSYLIGWEFRAQQRRGVQQVTARPLVYDPGRAAFVAAPNLTIGLPMLDGFEA